MAMTVNTLVKLTDPEREWLQEALGLPERVGEDQWEHPVFDFPNEHINPNVWMAGHLTLRDGGLWVQSMDGLNVGNLWVLQKFMEEHRPDGELLFPFSETGDLSEIDAPVGGGIIRVTADEVSQRRFVGEGDSRFFEVEHPCGDVVKVDFDEGVIIDPVDAEEYKAFNWND